MCVIKDVCKADGRIVLTMFSPARRTMRGVVFEQDNGPLHRTGESQARACLGVRMLMLRCPSQAATMLTPDNNSTIDKLKAEGWGPEIEWLDWSRAYYLDNRPDIWQATKLTDRGTSPDIVESS